MSFDSNLPFRDWPDADQNHDQRFAPVDSPAEEVSDGWLDEALRTVPLPSGFLDRMSVLAHPIFPDRSDLDRRFLHG
jgi:hypothetical protein